MDALSDILSRMKLAGTLYFRTSFTSPWSIRVPAYEQVSRFHFAHRGRCFVRVNPDQPPVMLEQGDLLIITRGAAHTLFCDPSNEGDAVLLDTVVEESGFTGHGALVYGEPGTHHETQLLCGHFAFDENASHPLIESLPEYIHIRRYGEVAGAWLESTISIVGAEANNKQMGSNLIALKMSEIIFAQALRTYLNDEGADRPVMAGFSDPNISRTLTAVHENPSHSWTLKELAHLAGMSRTAFIARFTQKMRSTPMGYITLWRMQLAKEALAESDLAIIELAKSVGYQSEAAFGRVFKRHFNVAPATYRRSLRPA